MGGGEEYLNVRRLCGRHTIKLEELCNTTAGEPVGERLKIIIFATYFVYRIIHELTNPIRGPVTDLLKSFH